MNNLVYLQSDLSNTANVCSFSKVKSPVANNSYKVTSISGFSVAFSQK